MVAGRSSTGSAKKGGAKSRTLINDLDLDVPVVDDLAIVHDARSKVASKRLAAAYDAADLDDDDEYAVLPHEAHDEDEGPQNMDDMQEEAEIAVKASRKQRKQLADDDFGLDALPQPAAAKPYRAAAATAAEVALEEVERDFSKLSDDERLAMLKAESPEVVALLKELGDKIDEADSLTAALKSARFATSPSGRDQELVDFLETKTALMLTYCAHVTFYLLLKAEGAKINNHPVVDRLVELRVFLEKLRPVEQRLHYSLNKLLAGGATGAKAKVSSLRPVAEFEGELFQANKARVVDDGRAARRKAVQRLEQHEKQTRDEEANMTRAMKKAIMRDGDLDLIHAADAGMHEDADQFLTNMMEDDDDDDGEEGGMSLIQKLRQKVNPNKLSGNTRKPKQRKPVAAAEEEGEFGEGDDDGDIDYDDLLRDERSRTAARDEVEAAASKRAPFRDAEVDRREVDQRILTHRGLTKSRPKDKKNPRVNRREKAKKGEKEANAQSRAGKKAEHADSFMGVPTIKPHITHTTRLA